LAAWDLLAIGDKRVTRERQIVFSPGHLSNPSDDANGVSRKIRQKASGSRQAPFD
jgi:hypothetical protein